MKTIIPLALLVVCCPLSVSAATIAYDLRDTLRTADIEAGAYTVGSVTLTMSSDQGDLNQTSSSFGINHSGGALDATAEIDSDEGDETLKFSFSSSGTLTHLTFTNFGDDDTFTLRKGEDIILDLTDHGSPDTFVINERFTSEDQFTLTSTQVGLSPGNGASLDLIGIDADSVVAPEPSSAVMLALGSLALLRRRR